MLQALTHRACYLLNRHDTIRAAVFSNWEEKFPKMMKGYISSMMELFGI